MLRLTICIWTTLKFYSKYKNNIQSLLIKIFKFKIVDVGNPCEALPAATSQAASPAANTVASASPASPAAGPMYL